MAGSIYSRLKTWISGEDVDAADINAEFDNILNNSLPAQFDDYSVNTAQMQAKTEPGEVGTESLATTLAGEIERLRFTVGEIKGTSQWYESATTSLTEIASVLGGGLEANRISSGKSSANSGQPLFLVPNGSAATVTIEGATTNLIYSINGLSYTISTDIAVTSLVAAPSSNNTALVNDLNVNDESRTKLLGEYGSKIVIDAVGSEISGLVGQFAGFKINNGVDDEYFTARVGTNELTDISRGYFFDSADASIGRVAIANNDTITLMKLTWVFATTTGAIVVTYTNPRVSEQEPSSPSTGDYWFDIDEQTWKTFNSTIWISADATLIGICLQDDTNTVAARGFDFFKNLDNSMTCPLVIAGVTEVRSTGLAASLSVYGTGVSFKKDVARWNMATDLESGVSEAASTTYYFYVTESGKTVISDVAPHDRRSDLGGLYHTHETWRCVGQAYNDASSNLTLLQPYSLHKDAEPAYVVSTSVSGNALTVNVHGNLAQNIKLANSTAASGAVEYRTLYGVNTIIIPSGATMGHSDNTQEWLYIYLLDNASNLEVAASSLFYSNGTRLTSVALSASSDNFAIYSTVARSAKAIYQAARLEVTQTTAGTWATGISEVALHPFLRRIAKRLSLDSGTFSTTSIVAGGVAVTNVSIIYTVTSATNILITLEGISTNQGYLGASVSTVDTGGEFFLRRDSTVLSISTVRSSTLVANGHIILVPPNLIYTDSVAPGTYTYSLYAKAYASGDTANAQYCRLVIKEIY